MHDSILLEVPTRKADRVIERAYAVMTRAIPTLPIGAWGQGMHGDALTIGVDVKVGKDWGSMTTIDVGAVTATVAADTVVEAVDPDEAEDVSALETSWQRPA